MKKKSIVKDKEHFEERFAELVKISNEANELMKTPTIEEWEKLKQYLLVVHEEYSDRNGLNYCKNCGVDMKDLVFKIENIFATQIKQAKKEERSELITRTIEAFGLKLEELPMLPNQEKLLETIIALGMAKRDSRARKEERELMVKEIEKKRIEFWNISPTQRKIVVETSNQVKKQLLESIKRTK
jgi:hypothetical protein